MRNHTSAQSFFVDLSMDSLPGPFLEIEVDVRSNLQTHDIRVKIPADSRQDLAATIISAFRKLNQLIVHAGKEFFNLVSHTLMTLYSQTHTSSGSSSRLMKLMLLRQQHWWKVMGCSSFVFRSFRAGCARYKYAPCYVPHYLLCKLYNCSPYLKCIDQLLSLSLACVPPFFLQLGSHLALADNTGSY